MALFDLQFVPEQEQISHSTDQINGFIWFAIRSGTRTDITFYRSQWFHLICNSFQNKNRHYKLHIRPMALFDLQFVPEKITDIAYNRSDKWLDLICNSFRNNNKHYILQIRSMALFDLQFVPGKKQTLHTTDQINSFIWFAIRSATRRDITYYR